MVTALGFVGFLLLVFVVVPASVVVVVVASVVVVVVVALGFCCGSCSWFCWVVSPFLCCFRFCFRCVCFRFCFVVVVVVVAAAAAVDVVVVAAAAPDPHPRAGVLEHQRLLCVAAERRHLDRRRRGIMSGPDDGGIRIQQGSNRLLQPVRDSNRPGRAYQQRCDVRNQIVSDKIFALLVCLEVGPLRYHK